MSNAKQPRKRACDNCYSSKIQCDRALPRCNWCHHRGLQCTFDRLYGGDRKLKTSKTRIAPVKNLLQRLERVEVTLRAAKRKAAAGVAGPRQQQTLGDSLTSVPSIETGESLYLTPTETKKLAGLSPGAHWGKLLFAGNHVGEVDPFNGIPFLSESGYSWIRFRTGTEPRFHKIDSRGPPWQDSNRSLAFVSATEPPVSTSASSVKLPRKQVLQHLIFEYCSSNFYHAFPIVDFVLFQDTIEAAYASSTAAQSSTCVGAQACLFAFLSVMSKCEKVLPSSPSIDGNIYAAEAQSLLPLIFLEPTMTTFQTMFMLAIYYLLSGNMERGMTLHSFSCRVLFSLNPHSHAHSPIGEVRDVATEKNSGRMKKHLRQIFWLAYSLDKDISLRTGKPPALNDDFCDLTLPEDYQSADTSRTESGTSPYGFDSPLPSSLLVDMRLAILKSKVHKSLYSPTAFQKQDAELLHTIRELDDELEKWRMSVDPAQRPTLGSVGKRTFLVDQAVDLHIRMQRNVAQFEFHYLLASIHRASGRCCSWTSGETEDLTGISSSISIAVQASRMTIHHLRAVVDVVSEEAFWLIVFYPMSAVMTLFCNILLDPLHPQVEENLGLIACVPPLIRGMRRSPTTPKDEGYLATVDDFIAELVRLGNCAVAKGRSTI